MKRGQGILPFELFHSMASKVYDALHLRALWHLHEAQVSFYHRSDGSGEYWVRSVVELLIEVTRGNTSAMSSSCLVFSPALISRYASCASSFIFILQGILGQIII
jgi:hypothetical protein